jgi:hypothetical protein
MKDVVKPGAPSVVVPPLNLVAVPAFRMIIITPAGKVFAVNLGGVGATAVPDIVDPVECVNVPLAV